MQLFETDSLNFFGCISFKKEENQENFIFRQKKSDFSVKSFIAVCKRYLETILLMKLALKRRYVSKLVLNSFTVP